MTSRHRSQNLGGLRFLQVYGLVLLLLPAVVVLPGPLKSNGSPAVILALISALLIGVTFVGGRVGQDLGLGAMALIFAASLSIVTVASGLIRPLDPLTQAGVTRGFLALVGYTGIALLTMLTMQNRLYRERLVATLCLALSFAGVIAILQGSGVANYRYLLRPPGFVLNRQFASAVRGGFTRASGTSDSPIELAVLMACLVALSVYLIRVGSSGNTRAVGGMGIFIGLLALPASVSRTGIVCLIAVGLVLTFTSTIRQFFAGLLTSVLITAFYALLVPSRAGDLLRLFTNASSDNSITGRTDDYAYVIDRFKDEPFFGSGLGTSLPGNTRFLDNQWLQATVQGGVTGIASLLVIFGSAAAGCAIGMRHADSDRSRIEFATYGAVVAAILASSFTFDLFAFTQARCLFFVVFGLIFAAVSESRAVTKAQVRQVTGSPSQVTVP